MKKLIEFFKSLFSFKKETKNDEDIDFYKQKIAESFGIEVSAIFYDRKSHDFIIDNDGSISLEDAKLRFPKYSETASATSSVTQRSHNYKVSLSKIGSIKIYCDPTVPTAWRDAVLKSMTIWNDSGSAVNMLLSSTATGATTTVTTTYATTNVIASASYPDYFGGPGRKLIINTYYNYLSDSQKLSTITHELGHIIGLTHTNESYGTLIPGTPTSDSTSIMNSTGLSITTLSPNDLTAVRTLYPKAT